MLNTKKKKKIQIRPEYIHHTKYIENVDKAIIYVMISSEVDLPELTW